MPGVQYGGNYQTPGIADYRAQQQQGAWWENMASQYGNMSNIPMVDNRGGLYQWAMDPATSEIRPVAYNPQEGQTQWGVGQMPGGGPQYTDWGGMTDRPEYQMPGAYGGGAGQSWSSVGPYQTGTYQPGSQWGQGQYGMGSGVMQQGMQGYAPESSLDPQRVIDASVAPLQHQRDVGFAEAAARAGGSGFAMSTPYMEQLGQVEQRSLQDLDKTTQEYLYNAAQFKAQQDLAAQQQALDRSLSAYGTHSGYGHAGQMRDLNASDAASAQAQAINAQGQMQDVGNQYNAWRDMGGWQMDANRAGQDAWRTENQYAQDAWRAQNQYANQDYWNAVNQWGAPTIAGQVMSAYNPYGSPYNTGGSFATQAPSWQNAQPMTQGQAGY